MPITKPPVLPTWADTGDKVQPTNAEIQAGWPLSAVPPSRQRFNWLQNFLFNAVRYFSRRGLPDYDAAETYLIGDRVLGSDNNVYRSLVNANTGNNPTVSPSQWRKWGSDDADVVKKVGDTMTGRLFIDANSASNQGLLVAQNGSADVVQFSGNAGQSIYYTAAGRLLLGTNAAGTLAGATGGIQTHGASSTFSQFQAYRYSADSGAPTVSMAKSRSATVGVQTAILADDVIGSILGAGSNGTAFVHGASIEFVSGANWTAGNNAAYIQFWTTNNLTNTRQGSLRLQTDGTLRSTQTYDATSAAAANLGIGATGVFFRSTSSLRAKTQVEPMDVDRAEEILSAIELIWFRSACGTDNSEWSFDGVAAEQLALIEPRLVHWGYIDSDYSIVRKSSGFSEVPETVEEEYTETNVQVVDGKAVLTAEVKTRSVPKVIMLPLVDADGNPVMTLNEAGEEVEAAYPYTPVTKVEQFTEEKVLNEGAELKPTGVAYERLAIYLAASYKKRVLNQAVQTQLSPELQALVAELCPTGGEE
jgi:hypothetical protein